MTLSNPVPYIRHLEYGTSHQAPHGMAGVAAAQWAEMVERAAELRREAQQQRGAGA